MSKVPAKHPTQARHDAGETGTSATVAPLPVLQMAPKGRDQAANIAKLTQLRANADKQFQLATDYSANTLTVGDIAHAKLQILSNTYSQAYDTFREVLNKAQQAAQNQQMWTDVVLGVICGTAAGLAAAFVLPSTAAGWFSLTLAEAGTAAMSSAGQGILSGGAQALLSKTVSVEGKAISSDGLQPSVQELAMWKKVALIYRSGLEVTPTVQASHILSGNLADRIADLRVYEAGGKSDLTAPKITTMMSALTQQDAQQEAARAEVAKKTIDLEDLKTAAAAIPTDTAVSKMEREIWYMWISTLPMNSNILDIDAIEDHIGPKGLRIVDFGLYTTRSDQNNAIDQALHHVTFMKAEASNSDVPADQAARLRVTTLNP
jgi:hypothetical protein